MWQQDATAELRNEIAGLGEMLGQTIEQLAGRSRLDTVETIRRLARDHRSGDDDATARLIHKIGSLDDHTMRAVIRAYTIFLDLANLAEDRHRVRVLDAREQSHHPAPRSESIEEALWHLKQAGKSPADIQSLLDELRIELVFTAHPTEAKRRSIRAKLRRIRETLYEADHAVLRRMIDQHRESIRGELEKLWVTDFIRPWRPTVLQEVQRGLSFKPVLWEVIPVILNDLRTALGKVYPGCSFDVRPCITFGSWIGGDRDGHPFVTSTVSEQTILWLRKAAVEYHLATCERLIESLSISKRQIEAPEPIEQEVSNARSRWPQLVGILQEIAPNEFARRWLSVIQWRLQQTLAIELASGSPDGSYARAEEFEADVELLHNVLRSASIGKRLPSEAQDWIDRIRTFGFHLARLDLRQDSRQYLAVIDELLVHAGLHRHDHELTEEERIRLLEETLSEPLSIVEGQLSDLARETLALFRLLRRTAKKFGLQAIGGHVISMTHAPSDVITVLWLWSRIHLLDTDGDGQPLPALPIIPLFETIDDLKHGPRIFATLLKTPAYRRHLQQQNDRQTIMLGYSDSTKDGGYLSACWSLYKAQQELAALADSENIQLTFFHGRGGSLGRGGGPTARSILSLPRNTFHGAIRLTEQGEVLADRYDDPRIAHRHLEQLVWSSLLATGMPSKEVPAAWSSAIEQLGRVSFDVYRELIEQPGFVDFFRRATPISEIEQLPIGSRPSRRRGGSDLRDLRAIPWVFSWTQSRCLVPAWYGLGSSVSAMLLDANAEALLQRMYREWPFFRATIANAELALAKTDLSVASRYAQLANDSETLARIGSMIAREYEQAKSSVLTITQQDELLDGTPWLKESIRVRNRYIDPLNLTQIELLRRNTLREGTDAGEMEEELRHLLRLSIKGLATGMRTSG